MANGATDPYSLESLGYGQISGATGGGQDLKDIVKGLFGTLRTGGYFGTGAKGKSIAELGYGDFFKDVGDYGTFMSGFESQFGEDKEFADEAGQGMQSLLGLLKSLDIPGMQKEYGQNVGDVGAEIGAQMQDLTSSLARGGKRGRYSSLSTSKRNLGEGGKNKYMSDYYGLKDKQFGMQQDLQKELKSDFNIGVGQYMQLNPYSKEE